MTSKLFLKDHPENCSRSNGKRHLAFMLTLASQLRSVIFIYLFLLYSPFILGQEAPIPDSINQIIENRLETLIKEQRYDEINRTIAIQNNISSELSNLLGTIQFLFALIGGLTTLILFTFTMYYRSEVRNKLMIAVDKLDNLKKAEKDFDSIKDNIEKEFEEIQNYKLEVQHITEELNRLKSRVQMGELKDKLYNSFSSDELNTGIFPKRDINILNKIVETIDFLEREGDTISAKDYYYKGVYFIGKKDYTNAIQTLKQAIELRAPEFYYEAYDALSAAFHFSHQYKEAINSLKKMLEQKKDTRKVRINIVYTYIKLNAFELAHHYCDLLEYEDIDHILAKSEIYLREGKYLKSLETIKRADPSNFHRLRGRILFHQKLYGESNSQFYQKIEIIDRSLSSLGNTYYDIDKKERLQLSKASIYLLIACNYFKMGKEKYLKNITKNYYSAISIDTRYSSQIGILELEDKRLNSFSGLEKEVIELVYTFISSSQKV